MDIRPIDAGRLKRLRRNIGKPYAIDDNIDDQVVDYRDIVNAPTLSLNTLRDEIYEDAVEHGLFEDFDKITDPVRYSDDGGDD